MKNLCIIPGGGQRAPGDPNAVVPYYPTRAEKESDYRRGSISRSQYLDSSYLPPGDVPTKGQKIQAFKSGQISRSEYEDNAYNRTTGNPTPFSNRAGISRTESSQDYLKRTSTTVPYSSIPTKQDKFQDFQSGRLSRSEYEDDAYDRGTGNPTLAFARAGISKTESSQDYVVRSAAEAAAKAPPKEAAAPPPPPVAKAAPVAPAPLPSPLDGKRGAKAALARRRGRSGSNLSKTASSGLGTSGGSGGSIINKKLG